MESINSKPLLDPISSDTEEDEVRIDGTINEDHIIVVRDDEPLFKLQEPKDHYLVVFFIFYLLGMITLLPWNFFITAHSYWMYKFRDTNDELNFFLPSLKNTPLQTSFTSYISIASNVPATIFLILNVALNKRTTLNTRVVSSFILMLTLFIITTIFVKIDTDEWQDLFFIITIVIVVLLNVASAILSGSIFGIVGKFSPKYITAVVGGQALGGIFTTLVQIITLSFGISSTSTAFIYFIIGDIIILISIVLYFVLIKSIFFKYHISDKMGVGINEFENELVQPQLISYKAIVKKMWIYGLSIFFIFFVTLSLFPGVTVLVESEEKDSGNKWDDVFFVPVVSYLLFNCGDFAGRVLAGLVQWPGKGSLQLTFSIIRIGLIPLLLLCNVQPRQYLPVIFNHDYYYVIIIVLISVSNGYFANLNAMSAPRVVKQHEKELASSIIAVFLGIGLSAGSFLSVIFIKYV